MLMWRALAPRGGIGYLMPTLLKLILFLGLYLSYLLIDASEKTPGVGPASSTSFLFVFTSYTEATRSLIDSLLKTLILGSLGRAEPALDSESLLKETPAEEKPVRYGLISIDWVTFLLRLELSCGPIGLSTVRLVLSSNSAFDMIPSLGDLKAPPETDGEFVKFTLSVCLTPALGVNSDDFIIFVMKGLCESSSYISE